MGLRHTTKLIQAVMLCGTPKTSEGEHNKTCTFVFVRDFMLMVVLDVALG